MKKIILIFITLLLFQLNTVYAEDQYSEWSTIPTGYPTEEEAIQYGVILPKTWSEWDINPATDEIDKLYEIKKDFGPKHNPKEELNISNVKGQLLCTWLFEEQQYITSFYADIDCYYWNGKTSTNYMQPAMELYVDGNLVAWTDAKSNVNKNWGVGLDIYGTKVELYMKKCSGDNRNWTVMYKNTTFVKTSLMKYSHVIEWYEPTNWRFDIPYENIYGDNPQKPAERIVYRYIINPKIYVDQRYIYEDDTLEDILKLASAEDYDGTDLTESIVIKEILYDGKGIKEKEPETFDPYLSDSIHVTYYVENESKRSDTKIVKLYILRDGEFVNLKIYDRYISEQFIYTLEDNSKWKNETYNNKLKDAILWLEGK